MSGTRFQIEINPEIPQRLARLSEIADNLWYTWDRHGRGLFARLNPGLWDIVGHSPKAFLKRIDQHYLRQAADDPIFLGTMNRVLSSYDTYHQNLTKVELPGRPPLQHTDLIAYFCAEFGFHESLPIYSGGLGSLAADHCKGASDLRLPFIAMGLLYRQGYFQQTIDRNGRQHAQYNDTDFDDLPITPARRPNEPDEDVKVAVEMPGRIVWAKVWKARAGNTTLYLLDADLPENSEQDRGITHQLYGGDRTMRIEQEILLGIGGARALRELDLKPTVWHINEGHAAFLILERTRGLAAQGLTFETALEAVASNTLFTTHTPVPAGHDHFSNEMIAQYFSDYAAGLKIEPARLIGLGQTPDSPEFNMTALAIRGSRFHNGVSRIHGHVSSNICAHFWPDIDPEENPMDYVTNSIHVPTFLATDWYETFDRHLGLGWLHRMTDQGCWQGVNRIPDQVYWAIRQSLKAQLLHLIRHRVKEQYTRNQSSEAHVDRVLRYIDPANPSVLTIGFARRFATYKRGTLLFNNRAWLKQMLCDPERPVLFIFAGKAHPADLPGQELIRQIHELSRDPDFEGKILLLEGYDLHLARRLVAGVDVWLNNPVYPLEASGTSGMKAAINGAVNLSVLDGWWDEGYDGKNGWAIKPTADGDGMNAEQRDAEEARTLYEILQDRVIPMYYRTGTLGYSQDWVTMSKHSIASIMPRFNMHRMVTEYVGKFYANAAAQWRRYAGENFAGALHVAEWKSRVRAAWRGVRLRRIDAPQSRIRYGQPMHFEVAVFMNGLDPKDLTVELVFSRQGETSLAKAKRQVLRPVKELENGEYLYGRELTPEHCGKLDYRIRAFPEHKLLTHPFEMGLMTWL